MPFLLPTSKVKTLAAASAVGSLIGIGAGRDRAVGTPIPKLISEAQDTEVELRVCYSKHAKVEFFLLSILVYIIGKI